METLQNEFRGAMRSLATTVCLITAPTEEGLRGLTATAVMSLSMDPPSLAAAVNRKAALNPYLIEGATLSIHLLSEEQTALAQAFAGAVPHDRRFRIGQWATDEWGCPALEDAPASISCVIHARHDVASHSLLVAHVRSVRLTPCAQPLLYAQGEYTGVREARTLAP